MGWRPDEVWLDVDVLWFGERDGALAIAGFVLPPLPRFGPVGLAASRRRREAWRRRRRTRATALMVLPAVFFPPALLRSSSAGAGILVEDPPSLAFPLRSPAADVVRSLPAESNRDLPQKAERIEAPKIDWRNATSLGLWWSGSLIEGTRLPIEGPNWVTWNPVTDSVPNKARRLHGNERTIRTLISVIDEYRAANPRAPRVVVGDISFEHGGAMDAHVSHQNGLDVDIYYPRLDGWLRSPGSRAAIDLRLSQDLLDRFVAAGAWKVFVGYSMGLDGPEKVVIPYPNHEDHMHVRFPKPGS
jgi:Penicillin-insensitive murein endopeptidase